LFLFFSFAVTAACPVGLLKILKEGRG
jgi:hypothetical protein